MNYKNSNKREIISEQCYNRLPIGKIKRQFSPTYDSVTHRVNEDDSDFLTSLIVAEVTGNAMMGVAAGGDLLGGIIGAELSNDDNDISIDTSSNDNSSDNSVDMGGGDFGGGGAGDDY